MNMAICSTRLHPRLTAIRSIGTVENLSLNSNPSHAQKSRLSIPHLPSSSKKCNLFTTSRRLPFPLPHAISPSQRVMLGEKIPDAIDVVSDLCLAIRVRDLEKISNLIADDCKCTCYFTPSCNVLEGKEHVMGFFASLLGCMGEFMEFEIETSCYGEGDDVGILWHLAWKGNPVPFGKGCSFYSCEEKDGKLLIRDMEMFLESLVKLGFLQLRVVRMVMFIFSEFVNLSLNWIGTGTSI